MANKKIDSMINELILQLGDMEEAERSSHLRKLEMELSYLSNEIQDAKTSLLQAQSLHSDAMMILQSVSSIFTQVKGRTKQAEGDWINRLGVPKPDGKGALHYVPS
jgi:hypothetical protein